MLSMSAWTHWTTIAVLALTGLSAVAAEEKKTAIPAAPKAGSTAPASQESLDVRYARLQLQLAETNLLRVRRMNQKVSNAVPANIVAEYQGLVAVARANLESRLQSQGKASLDDWLREAQSAAQTAQTRYRTSIAVNQRMAGTIDDEEVERLRLMAELTRLQVERGKAVADKPFDLQVRWQLDVLHAEIQQLQEQLRRVSPTSGVYPIYPYWWY
jgi:polyhydroxyalkanoate synthesis regulator phasin